MSAKKIIIIEFICYLNELMVRGKLDSWVSSAEEGAFCLFCLFVCLRKMKCVL